MANIFIGDYVEYTIATASTVTIYFNSLGTDTNTEKYVGLGYNARSFVLVPSDGIRINKVNLTTFTTPRPVSTAGISWKDLVPDVHFNRIEIETLQANTVLQLQVI